MFEKADELKYDRENGIINIIKKFPETEASGN